MFIKGYIGMIKIITSTLLSFLLLCLDSNQAYAKAFALNEDVKYEVFWSGIKVGSMNVQARQKADKYNIKAQLYSHGIAKTLSNFSSNVETQGVLSKASFPVNIDYKSNFVFKRKIKDVIIKTDASGNVITDSMTPPDNPTKRPLIDSKLKKKIVEPLSAIILCRNFIDSALKGGNDYLVFNLMDGKRFAKIHLTVKGLENVDFGDGERRLVHIVIKREAIAGYTNNELERLKEEEPTINGYLDPVRLIPIYAQASAPIGSALAKLVE